MHTKGKTSHYSFKFLDDLAYDVNVTQQQAVNLSRLRQQIHACSPLDMETMLPHFLDYVCQRLHADGVALVIAYRGKYVDEVWKADLLDDWKVMDYITLSGNISSNRALCEAYYQQARARGIGPVTRYALTHTGKTRTHRYADVIQDNDEEWQQHWKREELQRQKVGDRMIGVYHLDAEAESYVVVDRATAATPFSQEDEAQLMDCLLEFPRLHYWLFLERGLLAWHERPCSPKQREIIPLLFSSMTEKQIAETIGVSRGTAHGYIVEIYRNFGVKSRAELASLWLAALSVAK